MEFGIFVRNLTKLPVKDSVDYMLGMARKADELGFYSVWVADHFFFPVNMQSRYPYNETGRLLFDTHDNVFEPLTVLASFAAITRRVKLGTNVLILPYRHPLLTAKVLATIDALSNGRVILGAGVGWMKEEFDALGAASYEHRGTLTDEYIRMFKELWTQEMPSFEGRWYKFSGFGFEPRPVRKPHIPIWIGGNSEAALRRVARLGDGWHALSVSPEDFSRGIQRLQELCKEHKRRFEDITLSMNTSVTIDLDAKDGEAQYVPPSGSTPASYIGSPKQFVATFKKFQRMGLQHFCCHVVMKGQSISLTSVSKATEVFAREVMPQFR